MTILSVSGESKEKIAAFVDKTKAAYPIFCQGNANDYSTGGVPTSALISADGKVVWQGHPSKLSDDLIGTHLKKVKKEHRVSTWAFTLDRALPNIPEKFAAVRKDLVKKKFGSALKRAESTVGKLEGADKENGDAVVAFISKRAEDSMEQADTLVAEGKVFDGFKLFETVEAEFKGHAFSKKAKEAAKALTSDKGHKLEIKAGEMLEKLKKEIPGERKAEDKIDLLKPLLGKKYADTEAGKTAAKMVEEFEKKVKK